MSIFLFLTKHKMKDANYFITNLEMNAHPEGGYYKQSFLSDQVTNLNQKQRQLWSSIYFLLCKDEVSNFHRLTADEMWYFHSGSALTIYMITPDGELITQDLGLEIEKGQKPQILVPKGYIFGSAMHNEGYSLVGCMVSPGFTFEDFELFERNDLLKMYPEHEKIIKKLTR